MGTLLERNYSRWVKYKTELKESWAERDPETLKVITISAIVAVASSVFLNKYGQDIVLGIAQVFVPLN